MIDKTCRHSSYCVGDECRCDAYRHMTNADRIRNMTDEELASVITDDWCEIVCSGTDYLCNDGACEQHVLKWLKEEVGET